MKITRRQLRKLINEVMVGYPDERAPFDAAAALKSAKKKISKEPALADMFDDGKIKDFGYWGRMKPSEKNVREKTIRQIYRSELSTVLVGGFPSGVQRQSAWIKDWKVLYPMLEKCRATLCFNWLDPTATTSRYPEALSIGMIPFVWGDYDKNNTYNIDEWQRVSRFEDLEHRVKQLRNETLLILKLTEYRNNYKKVLLSEQEYFERFSDMMDRSINDN